MAGVVDAAGPLAIIPAGQGRKYQTE